MSPDAVSAAISAVRQQMCNMVAAAHHTDANLMPGFNIPGHLSVHPHTTGGAGTGIPIPKLGSPANLNPINNNGGASGIPMPRLGSPASHAGLINIHAPPTNSQTNSHNSNPSSSSSSISGATTTASHSSHPITTGALSITRISSPHPHDLRMNSPEDSPVESPLSMVLEPAVNLAVGDHYKSSKIGSPDQRSSTPPSSRVTSFKETAIKVEPLTECRGE